MATSRATVEADAPFQGLEGHQAAARAADGEATRERPQLTACLHGRCHAGLYSLALNLQTTHRAEERNMSLELSCANSQEVLEDQGDGRRDPEASRSGPHWTSRTVREQPTK